MTREELLKMSKKDLKNRLAELGKNAQTLSGQELTDAMDEARTIGEILDEIKGREELVAAAKAAGAEDPDEGDGAGEGSEEPQDQERAKRGKTLKDGKKAFWHTASHVLAQAVKRLYPNAKFAIGPAIEGGFYYDFDVEKPFTTEDLEQIEAEMKNIVKSGLALEKLELAPDEAVKLLEENIPIEHLGLNFANGLHHSSLP